MLVVGVGGRGETARGSNVRRDEAETEKRRGWCWCWWRAGGCNVTLT